MKTKVIRFNRVLIVATIIVGCLFFVQQVSAQSKKSAKTPEERATIMTDKMKEKLVLTDDQYKPVYDINLKYAQKNDELMKSSDDKRTQMKKMKSAQEAKDGEMKAILTDDQYKKYGEVKEEMKEKMKTEAKSKKSQKKSK